MLSLLEEISGKITQYKKLKLLRRVNIDEFFDYTFKKDIKGDDTHTMRCQHCGSVLVKVNTVMTATLIVDSENKEVIGVNIDTVMPLNVSSCAQCESNSLARETKLA